MASVSDSLRAKQPQGVAENANLPEQRRRSESRDRTIAAVVERTQSSPPRGENRSNAIAPSSPRQLSTGIVRVSSSDSLLKLARLRERTQSPPPSGETRSYSIGPSSPRQLPAGIVRVSSSENLLKLAKLRERTQSPPPPLQRSNSLGLSTGLSSPRSLVRISSREQLRGGASLQVDSDLQKAVCDVFSARDEEVDVLMKEFRENMLITEKGVNVALEKVFFACDFVETLMQDHQYENFMQEFEKAREKYCKYSIEVFTTFHRNGKEINQTMLMSMLRNYKRLKHFDAAIELYEGLQFSKEGFTNVHRFMFNLILEQKQDNWELLWRQFLRLYGDDQVRGSKKEFLDIIIIKCMESHQNQAECVVKFCVDNDCSPDLTCFDKLVRCDTYKSGVARVVLFKYVVKIFPRGDPRMATLYFHLQALAKAAGEPNDLLLKQMYSEAWASPSTPAKSI